MSPILVRPVREQLEHDRIIRLLQTKFRRKYRTGINPGNERNIPAGTGPAAGLYPDLVLNSLERGRRLHAVVEVETGESVNHLEALAEWAHFSRLRTAFHLYVPSAMVDVARHLCEDNKIHVTEIWSYHALGDEVRFALVHRTRAETPAVPRGKASPALKKPAAAAKKPAAKSAKKPAPAKAAKATRVVKAAKKPARAQKRK